MAHPDSTLLGSFPEMAGTSQSLFHYNPTAQCSWQRPLLLVQQKASLRCHSSNSHLLLRPVCSRHSHSQETQLVLACGTRMDNQLLLQEAPSALCTGRLHYHPSRLSANSAVSQLPSPWSAPLRNSTLPPPGYPNLCPPGTRALLRTIIAFSSEAPPKVSTLLHGLARRLTLPSTHH